jgi:hypothetical protein
LYNCGAYLYAALTYKTRYMLLMTSMSLTNGLCFFFATFLLSPPSGSVLDRHDGGGMQMSTHFRSPRAAGGYAAPAHANIQTG